MKNVLCSIMLALMANVVVYSQNIISGRIIDGESGDGLLGATIKIKGSTQGTITDFDGNFSLQASSEDILEISFIGYETQEFQVGNQTTINVTLQVDVSELSEVVVIGYGETTVKDATGAVVAVTSKDFNGGIISSPEQLIQGKTAGVQITSTSGNPGDGIQIRIRGTNSVRSDNNPLFVVDGVPLSGGTTASGNVGDVGTTSDVNPLNFLNPADIASINILKDASATAIYGSRGANGVIIIKTKDGKGLGEQLEFTSSVSVATPANKYDLLNRQEFLDAVTKYGGSSTEQDKKADTDWQDVILRTTVSHKQNLSYSNTIGENTNIRASFGYENQNGIVENSSLERYTGRLNGSKSFLNDKLNLNLSATYSRTNREDPPISGSAGFRGDLLGAAYSANPTWPALDTFSDVGGQIHPSNLLANYQSKANTNRILTNISLNYQFTSDLSAKLTYGTDYSNADRVALLAGKAKNLGTGVENGQGGYSNNLSLSHLGELTLTYTKDLGVLDIELLGGYSIQSFRNKYFWSVARGFGSTSFENMREDLINSFESVDEIASAIYDNYSNWGVSSEGIGGAPEGAPANVGGFVNAVTPGASSVNLPSTRGGVDSVELTTTRSAFFSRPRGVSVDAIAANFFDQTDFLQSYFGRGNFVLSDRYLLTLTLRVDGSSKFGADDRYGIFPSAAFAWQLDEEDFIPDAFSTLKLRLGYGIVGNQEGLGYGNFVRRERWADVNIDAGNRTINFPGTTTQGFANSGLKWEETTQQSLGLDFGINNGRIYGSIDYYIKETKDLLLQIQPAQPAVADRTFENLDAIVENKGWELALGVEAIKNENVSLNLSVNFAQNDNIIKDFGGRLNAGTIRGQGLSGAFAQQLAGGQPLFSYYIREFKGFDDNGQPIGDEQKFLGKSALPKHNAGFSLNLIVGNFDFSTYFAGQFGHYIYNNTQNAFFTAGSIGNARNVTHDVLSTTESESAEASVSTRFLSKGDFIRMQNLTIGYDVPVDGFLNSLRFSLNAQNLLLITDYNGLDPEVSTNPANFDLLNGLPTAGIDYTSYPRPRVFTLGINVTF